MYIEPEIEREVEAVPVRTDDELVAEVLKERAIERGGDCRGGRHRKIRLVIIR